MLSDAVTIDFVLMRINIEKGGTDEVIVLQLNSI